jgi:hypothetical protein
VTSREESAALSQLNELSATDLSKVSDEELLAGVRTSEMAFERSPLWSGRFIAELKRRHSWSEIVKMTGLPQTTLHRRAQPYL